MCLIFRVHTKVSKYLFVKIKRGHDNRRTSFRWVFLRYLTSNKVPAYLGRCWRSSLIELSVCKFPSCVKFITLQKPLLSFSFWNFVQNLWSYDFFIIYPFNKFLNSLIVLGFLSFPFLNLPSCNYSKSFKIGV
jgi:hypothetical protein